MKNTASQSGNSSPIRNSAAFAPVFNPPRPALVHSLLRLGCPTAIIWAVVSVVVLSFNLVECSWLRSHVGVEILERFSPAVADRDSATTIVRVALPLRILATLNHPSPYSVLWESPQPVSSEAVGMNLTAKAPAAFCSSRLKLRSADYDFVAIVATNAFPHDLLILATSIRDDAKSSKCMTDKAFNPTGGGGRGINVSHDATSYLGCKWIEPADVYASVRLVNYSKSTTEMEVHHS